MFVTLVTGKQPQTLTFGVGAFGTAASTLSNTTSTVQASNPLFMDGLYHTFQCITTGTTATTQIQVSNDQLTGEGIGALLNTTNTSTAATLASPPPYDQRIVTGMLVVGAGIPAGTTVTVSGSSITLSVAATATNSNVPVTFRALNWVNLGSAVTSTPGTPAALADVSSWRYCRANVTAVTGTSQTILGV